MLTALITITDVELSCKENRRDVRVYLEADGVGGGRLGHIKVRGFRGVEDSNVAHGGF